MSAGLRGSSSCISGPDFPKYVINSNRWATIFSLIRTASAMIGFYIYGEVSSKMDNPGSLYIGFGIGYMFFVIVLFLILVRKHSTTWDSTIEDKKIKKTTRFDYDDNNNQ